MHDIRIDSVTPRIAVFRAAAALLLVVCSCLHAGADDGADTAPAGGKSASSAPGSTTRPAMSAGAGQKSTTKPAASRAQTRPATTRPAGGGKTGGQFWRNQDGPSAAGTLWKMLAYVVVILVLGAGAMVVTKKVLPRLRSGGGGQMAVTETVHLGAAATVHLLEVDGRRFMVGATRERVSMLAELGGTFPDIEDLARKMDQDDSRPVPEGDE